jgi:hypothetical protein
MTKRGLMFNLDACKLEVNGGLNAEVAKRGKQCRSMECSGGGCSSDGLQEVMSCVCVASVSTMVD